MRKLFFKRTTIKFILIVGYILFLLPKTYSSQIIAADLIYECVGTNEYEFTLSLYRSCKGIAAPVSPALFINSQSCGTDTLIQLTAFGIASDVSLACNSTSTDCNGGSITGIKKFVYKGRYVLPFSCSDWVFSYSECCRSNQITNLATKDNLYIEATLDNSIAGCNSSPVYTSLPAFLTCNAQSFNYNPGAIDSNGDSLVYTLINPLQGPQNLISYKPGYAATYPIISGGVLFDERTGQLEFTSAFSQVCAIAMQVKEYRHGILIGSTMRDMQLQSQACTNTLPVLSNEGEALNQSGGFLIAKNKIEVCPGEMVSFDINGTDADGNIITLTSNIAQAIPGATFTIIPSGTSVSAHFSWTPVTAQSGMHVFTVTVKDDACPISGTQTYTYSIHVMPQTTVGPDRFYCPAGGEIQLLAEGGTSFNWTLADGSPANGLSCTNCNNPLTSPSTTTTYVVASNYSGTCRNSDTITIHVVPDFSMAISDDDTLCSSTDGIDIYVAPQFGNTYRYSWTPSANLSTPSQYHTVARPRVTTTYYASVTSAQGCTRRDSVTIVVKNLIRLVVYPKDTAETCDSLRLSVFMIPEGEILSENFDADIDSSNWISITGGQPDTICGAYSNESYYLNGTGLRSLTTKDLDVTSGGSISFFVKAGFCVSCLCDKPENDEQDENLYLEYSTDGGISWSLLYTINADEHSALNNFVSIDINIPDEAKTSATRFRWQQLNHFPDKDVWVLDDIKIRTGLSGYKATWYPPNKVTDPEAFSTIAFPYETTTYEVAVTDTVSGCVLRKQTTIIFKKEFELYTSNLTFCPEDTNFTLQIPAPNGGDIYTYEWIPPAHVSDPTILNPKITVGYATSLSLIVRQNGSECYRRSDIEVNFPMPIQIFAGLDTSVCKGDSVPLKASVPQPYEYDFLWRPIAGISDQTSSTPFAKPTGTMNYIVFVQSRQTLCTNSDTLKVKVYPDFKLTTTGEATVCPEAGATVTAWASPGTGYQYRWYPAPEISDTTLQSQQVHPPNAATYFVVAGRPNNCWKKDSVNVVLYNNTLNVKASADTTIQFGDAAFLSANGATRYLWKSGDTEIDSSRTIIVSPETKTTYLLIGYDDCYSDSTTVIVDVLPLHIPNLFTPNGDGINDYFKITDNSARWNLEVYNRWNKLVFKKEKYTSEWDGANLSDGIYFYQITDSYSGHSYNGWIQIVR